MSYMIEIEERKTGESRRSQVGNEWSGDASRRDYARMCDCQLAGYYFAKCMQSREGQSWSNAFINAQFEYLRSNKCNHSKPSAKFHALRAYLHDGSAVAV